LGQRTRNQTPNWQRQPSRVVAIGCLRVYANGKFHMPPTIGNGKICYIQIPATDIARSAEFYQTIFGWTVRRRSNGSTAFDDGVGEVSGEWVTGRAPSTEPGLLFYIMVANVSETIEAIVAHGSEIVQQIGADHPEITARFRDPGGNIIGIYQEPASTLNSRRPETRCCVIPLNGLHR